jgi:aryl-alcohol dehydrogenase-like predicted oxidoreductase
MWRQRINRSAGDVSLAFVELAQEHGYSPSVAAVAWVRQQALVTAPIIGPRTMEQFQTCCPPRPSNCPQSLLHALDELVPPGTAVADFLNNAGWQIGHLPGLDNDKTSTA